MKKLYILFFTFTLLTNFLFAQEEQPTPAKKNLLAKKKRKPKVERQEGTQVEASKQEPVTPQTEATPTQQEQPAAPVAATPPVEFEQATWEKSEAVELEKEDSLPLTKNESTEKIVSQAIETNQSIQTTVNQILKKREETYSKYAQIDGKLDTFLQEISILGGQFKSKISQAEEQEKSTTDANKKIELELYKRDWEQLKTDVEKVDGVENKLIEELKKLDEKVDEALEYSINAKKINLDILKSANEQDAQTKLNQLKELQQKGIALQNSISTEFFNKVDLLSSQIQTEMQTLQERTKKLEAKAKELKLSEEAAPVEKKTLDQTATEDQAKATPTEQRYIYTKTVAATAWFINFLTKIKDWFKNLISGQKNTTEQTPEKTTTQAPNPEPEETIKKLEEEKAKIAQQTQNLEKIKEKRQEQHQTLQTQPQEATQAAPQEQAENQPTENSTWRKELEYAFGKFLDMIGWCVEKTQYYSKKLYDTYAKEKITNFVTDVHAKIEEQQKVGEEPPTN